MPRSFPVLQLLLPQGFAHTPLFSGNSLYPYFRGAAAEVLRWKYLKVEQTELADGLELRYEREENEE